MAKTLGVTVMLCSAVLLNLHSVDLTTGQKQDVKSTNRCLNSFSGNKLPPFPQNMQIYLSVPHFPRLHLRGKGFTGEISCSEFSLTADFFSPQHVCADVHSIKHVILTGQGYTVIHQQKYNNNNSPMFY